LSLLRSAIAALNCLETYGVGCLSGGRLIQLHSGQISSVLWESLQRGSWKSPFDVGRILEQHSHFLVSDVLPINADCDPIATLLFNLLQRGMPTLLSLNLEKQLAAATGITVVNEVGKGDTLRWEVSFAAKEEHVFSQLEFVLDPVNPHYESGSAPGFNQIKWDSDGEREFYHRELKQVLGAAWQFTERQRPLTSIVDDEEFHGQMADFCLELPGCIDDMARGVVIEFDGPQHQEEPQKTLDAKRDNACKKAGWIVVRVPATSATSLHEHPGVKALHNHPRWKSLEMQQTAFAHNPTQEFLALRDLLWLPYGIARLQQTVAYAWRAGILTLDQPTWRLAVVERDAECAHLAMQDLRTWIQALLNLYLPGKQAPEIALQSFKPEGDEESKAQTAANELPFDLLLDHELFGHPGTEAQPVTNVNAHHRLSIRGSLRPLQERTQAYSGIALPQPDSFAEPALRFFLNNVFRKGRFREKQLDILQRALKRQSTVALLPTGAGKSLTYQLSALLTNGLVLIVDPIKSLMKDQVDNLKSVGIDCTAFINSTMSGKEKDLAGQALSNGRFKFTFISPERLLIDDFRRMLREMKCHRFCFAVVDEAHCVSEWGHDFRTAYLRLGENLRSCCPAESDDEIAILALTGTASHEVLDDIRRELQLLGDGEEIVKPDRMARNELHFHIIPLEPKPEIPDGASDWTVSNVFGEARQKLLIDTLESLPGAIGLDQDPRFAFPHVVEPTQEGHGSALVFCPHVNWVHGVKNIESAIRTKFDSLDKATGVYAGSLSDEHGDNSLVETQNHFKQGRITALVCTKAFGMGIDKPDIRLTVHLNIPQSLEAFYQEAGRAGRDRQDSHCLVLYADKPRGWDVSLDFHLMESFHKESFKGQEQELAKIFDLLDRNRVPGATGADLISTKLTEETGVPIRCNLWIKGGLKRLYLNEQFAPKGVSLGFLDLNDMKIKGIKNTFSNVGEVTSCLMSIINENGFSGVELVDWLKTKADPVDGPGLEEILDEIKPSDERLVNICFDNGIAESLAEFLAKKWPEWTPQLVEKAYAFTYTENEFLEALSREYWKATKNDCILTGKAEDAARKAWNILRTESQTFRIVYRLSTLGVIRDYTIDYAARIISIWLQKPIAGGVTSALQAYVGRYESRGVTDRIPEELDSLEDASELRRCSRRLVRFVYEKIASKRLEALKTMDRTVRAGVKDPQQFTRELYLYFDSRYTEEMRIDVDEFDETTPEKILTRIELTPHDTSHLLGSCNRLLGEQPENAALHVIRAACLAVIQSYSEADVQDEVYEGIRLYEKHVPDWDRRMELELLTRLAERVRLADPERALIIDELIAAHHVHWIQSYLEEA
jgi:superfamily II DNA helicase RecQ